jgi:hypothetical protein
MAGWIGFAAVMMLIVGILDFIEGLIAIVRDNYFVLTSNQLIVFDTTTWGWITLIWGAVLVLAGLGLWAGSGFARWLTVALCSVNIVGQLAWLGGSATSLWTLTILTLSIVVIYALVARWDGYPETVTG